MLVGVLVGPAWADGDFLAIAKTLRDQISRTPLPGSEKGGAIETEAEGVLRKTGLPAIFGEEKLGSIEANLNVVHEALGEELAEIDPLLALDAYVGSGGDAHKFLKTLSFMTLPHPIVWKSPEVRKAVDRCYDQLSRLDKDSLMVSYSGRYHGPRWTFDSVISWNAFKRHCNLYVVGSSPLPGGRSKSITLNVSASVVPHTGAAPHQHTFQLNIDELTFHANSSEVELVGRWNHRLEPTSGTMVTMTNQLTLKVVDVGAQGKLIQEVLITDPKGKVSSGRITYSLAGRVNSQGELSGTFEAVGEPAALTWVDSPAPEKLRGTWQGKLDRAGASGTITVRASNNYTIPWEAKEQK